MQTCQLNELNVKWAKVSMDLNSYTEMNEVVLITQ